ncbi:FIP1[V]-like protein isoform X1 [Elaeis guineensis]|uniref:FIP1[V]-like protein isoform X2 n=1 Tax=Elaeis guineensis var. tenera TaxID=51953 RepID=A0A6I9S971_ELAGV|nr:FIP1[V]-like protein isoform X2 [Elaeis guineensis]
MDDDDEFGDLYTDVLRFPTPSSAPAPPSPPPQPRSFPSAASASKPLPEPLLSGDGDDDDLISHGASRPKPPAPPPSVPSQTLAPAPDEDGDDDWLLGHAPPAVEPPANWDDEEDEVAPEAPSRDVPEAGERRVLEEDYGDEARVSEFPKKDAEVAEEAGDGDPFLGGGARESMGIGDLDQAPVIPGLSAGPAPPGPFLDMDGGDVKASRSEDWDTDSEDDLQIVLNDNHVPLGGERNDRGGDEDDDDEDGEEDLVIVTDEDQHHHIPAMEEQDWGEEAIQPAGDGERKEMADVAKGNGPAGTAPAARIGYSSHGFSMQHHSTYKYIRPGAVPVSGGPSGGAVGPPGQVRPPLPLGLAAGRGRGDWRPAGGRGIPNAPKSFHSFGGPAWSNGSSVRAFGSGLDFTLPAHKTIFDVDIESFEEKPWRHPGVDISDFFNFGLDEDKWKDYCKQLDQLRLEATMQSKIRVYESGRSEQEYDPDLPPELAAAAGHHDISADNGYHGRADNRQTDFNSQGSGAANIRPTGRAIQVESGYGERQPSIDTRQPRLRDSDAIIEIVLQDSMDDPAMNDGAVEKPEKDLQGEHYKGGHEFEDERHVTSEHDNRNPHSLSGRKREMAGRGPFAPDEDGILPIPSEAHGRHHSNSKSRSPVYSSGSFGGNRDARLARGTSQGRHSSASGEPSNDVVPSQSAHSKRHDDHQKEKLLDSTEVNQTSEVSPAVAGETAGELSIEQKYEHDEKLALADSIDVEGEEITSDFHISSETVCDDNLIYPHKKQKLSSQVEQPAVNDTGDEDELRTSHSDNSRAKTGSSKDYQKRHENGEEVMQDGRSRRMGNISKRREGEEYILRRKDDYGRDARQETDRNRIASKGRENMYHSYGHRDWDPTSAHPVRDRSFERPKESSSSVGVRQRRQDSIQSRRVKDEDIKRERSEETESRHRSKVRASDRNDRDEDLHLKQRMDDGDWRGRNRDGTSRQRERDDILMSRRENLDDSYIRRKKDEEVSRRGKADKEDALHGYRGREDSSRRKRERDDDIDYRRREDGPRLRDKAQDHYSSKHKDDSLRHREREDRQQVKQLHENAPTHRERDEGRRVVRSGRAIQDKGLCRNGRNKDELKTLGSDKDYQDKDRKRYNEQSKRGDRAGEENVSHHKGHGDVHACEKQHNKDERNSRHERLSTHNERPSSASDSQQMYRDRHRENTRKGKDGEANEQNNQSLGRRKHEDHNIHQNDKVSLKGTNEQESSNFSSATLSKKDHHQIHEQLKVHQLHDSLTKQGEEDLASDDENQQGSRRGRSKLERWTSHKERDYSATQNVQTLSSVSVKEDEVMNADVIQVDELTKTEGNTNAGELEPTSGDVGQTMDKIAEERHLDTMAKLKRRSERFRLPMPGEKETTQSKKVENEVRLTQNEAVADTEVKPERPARKRRWTGS